MFGDDVTGCGDEGFGVNAGGVGGEDTLCGGKTNAFFFDFCGGGRGAGNCDKDGTGDA